MPGNVRTQLERGFLTQNWAGDQRKFPEAGMPQKPRFPPQLCCQAPHGVAWPTQAVSVDQA